MRLSFAKPLTKLAFVSFPGDEYDTYNCVDVRCLWDIKSTIISGKRIYDPDLIKSCQVNKSIKHRVLSAATFDVVFATSSLCRPSARVTKRRIDALCVQRKLWERLVFVY